jgi:hypothetical protein
MMLYIADTTEVDFSGQNVEDVGRLCLETQRDMCRHPTNAVLPNWDLLGISLWERE